MIDVSAWPGLQLVAQIAEGNRNEVWQGELHGNKVAVRRSRRSQASLQWELDLLAFLDRNGFRVPTVIPTGDGATSSESVVVQRWLDGAPPESDDDWHRVAIELQRLHRIGDGYPQRPNCCTVLELAEQRRSVDADLDIMPAEERALVLDIFAEFSDAPLSLIHGDLNPSNLRLDHNGVGLLDWDESRCDISWHDLSNLGVVVLDSATHQRAERLSHAWEAANAWGPEPVYAIERLQKLQPSD